MPALDSTEAPLALLNRLGEAAPETVFPQLLPVLGEALGCDRIFLYLRSPHQRLGGVPYCWRRHSDIPPIHDEQWQPEPEDLPQSDPMFAAALAAEPSIFVEDVEAASPEVLNRDFERRTFGHRALIHAHLCQAQQLWGVLQPCQFDHPRVWSAADRQLIFALEPRLTPLAIDFVTRACP